MTDKWYEPATGLTVQDRLRRPLVSHAPKGVITDDDLARQLVDDRSDALVRIMELEAALDEIHGAGYAMSRGINGGVSTMCMPIGAWDNAMKARNPK